MEASITIRYISYGNLHTGGKAYEGVLADILKNSLEGRGTYADIDRICPNNDISNFRLFLLGWKASAPINLVVGRVALTAIVRNLFSKRLVLTVLHNHDASDYSSVSLKIYKILLFALLRLCRQKRFGIVTVAPYWFNYFSNRFPNMPVFLFPNLVEVEKIKSHATGKKNKCIHLGQLSPKNDPAIFVLAKELSREGYNCYFTSLNPAEAGNFDGYSVRYSSWEDYIRDMSEAEYTLALTNILEGWNRIAHESIISGTTVIGYDKGGLGNLLKEAGQIVVKNTGEAKMAILEGKKVQHLPEGFIEKYDIRHAGIFAEALTDFCLLPSGKPADQPLVSVVMPVYNGETFVADAVRSILAQTYNKLELIIVDDASDDATLSIIQTFSDERIRYIQNEETMGNAYSRNLGHSMATGKYIAIHDSDDVSAPGRLAIQLAFLEKHPWTGLCGSFMQVEKDGKLWIRRYPSKPAMIRAYLFSKNPVGQPSVMFRRSVIAAFGLRHLKYYEDFNLWYKASQITRIANIPKPLVLYRLFDTSQKRYHRQIKEITSLLLFEKKMNELGVQVNPDDREDFARFMKGYLDINPEKYFLYRKYLDLVQKANRQKQLFPKHQFNKCLAHDRLRLWKFLFLKHKTFALLHIPYKYVLKGILK
jgi:glycosyltransferase involved in cell wall biosynthesis